MGGSVQLSRQANCPVVATCTLSGTAEVNGDHVAVLELGPYMTGQWYNDSSSSWVSMQRVQSFLFTSAGESYQLKFFVSGYTADNKSLAIPYSVYGIYAPSWAAIKATITAMINPNTCCDTGETWQYLGNIGGNKSCAQYGFPGTTVDEPTCHGILTEKSCSTGTQGVMAVSPLFASQNVTIPGLSVTHQAGTVSCVFDRDGSGNIRVTYDAAVNTPPTSFTVCSQTDHPSASTVVCITDPADGTIHKYRFTLVGDMHIGSYASGVCNAGSYDCNGDGGVGDNGTAYYVSKYALSVEVAI